MPNAVDLAFDDRAEIASNLRVRARDRHDCSRHLAAGPACRAAQYDFDAIAFRRMNTSEAAMDPRHMAHRRR